MLRASIQYSGGKGEIKGIAEGAKGGDSGIEHGERLTAFAEAAVRGEKAALDAARDALRDAAGSACVVDAAGVVGNFERMVRIADGTGIPLDGLVEVLSNDFRHDLGLDDYQSRRTTDLGFMSRTFGPLVRGAVKTGLRLAGRRTRRTRSS
jgi:hypothetical protein